MKMLLKIEKIQDIVLNFLAFMLLLGLILYPILFPHHLGEVIGLIVKGYKSINP
ncbi:MAG: hypothetical protein WCI48_13205 [Bacteroidota bacterium]